MQQYMDRLRQRYVHQPVQWATIAGFVVMIVGVFGPWATLSAIGIDLSTDGFDHKGDIVLILSLAGLGAIGAYAFTNVKIEERMLMWGLVAGVVLIDLLVILDFFDIMPEDGVGVGWGLWLTIGGAIVATAGAVVPMWSEIRSRASSMTENRPGA